MLLLYLYIAVTDPRGIIFSSSPTERRLQQDNGLTTRSSRSSLQTLASMTGWKGIPIIDLVSGQTPITCRRQDHTTLPNLPLPSKDTELSAFAFLGFIVFLYSRTAHSSIYKLYNQPSQSLGTCVGVTRIHLAPTWTRSRYGFRQGNYAVFLTVVLVFVLRRVPSLTMNGPFSGRGCSGVQESPVSVIYLIYTSDFDVSLIEYFWNITVSQQERHR